MNKKIQNNTLSIKASDTIKTKLEKISEEYGLSSAATLRFLITKEYSNIFSVGDRVE